MIEFNVDEFLSQQAELMSKESGVSKEFALKVLYDNHSKTMREFSTEGSLEESDAVTGQEVEDMLMQFQDNMERNARKFEAAGALGTLTGYLIALAILIGVIVLIFKALS